MRRTTTYCAACYRRTPHLDGRCGVCFPPDSAPERTPEPASLDLFGQNAVRAPAVRGSETSEAAADRVDVRGQCAHLLGYVLDHPEMRPFTDNDLLRTFPGMEYAPGKKYSINSPRARRVDLTNGPLKQMTDGSWQRVEAQGGYFDAVGVKDGETLFDVTDKARAWGAKRKAAA